MYQTTIYHLSWAPGFEGNAAYHDVYFGTDYSAVFSATDPNALPGRGRQPVDANTYNPFGDLDMELATIYYWRIDEVNGPNVWKGDIWWFDTIAYSDVIDDMEDYNNTTGYEIFDTWIDWIGGSQLILETTADANIHSGQQSMKFIYNNSTGSFYSEIKRTYATPQKWLWYNPKALGLYFKGTLSTPYAADQMYLGLADTGNVDDPCLVIYDRPLNNLTNNEWQRWDIDLQDFTDIGVDLNDGKQIFIGFGDRSSPSQGGNGIVYFDDIRLYLSRCVPDRIPTNFNGSSDCKIDSEDLDIMTDYWLIPSGGSNLTTVAPDSNNLVNWWKFDEGTGTNAADDGTAGNNGTLISAVEPIWVDGIVGPNALLFDGDNDAVILGSNLTVFSSSFTVSAWVKVPFNTTDRVGIILGDNQSDNSVKINFEIHGKGDMRVYWAANPDLRGETDLRDGSWHLLTWVRDKATEKVYGYVDGNPDFEYSGAIVDRTPAALHRIGRDQRSGNTAFEGAIDDIRIYSYALSHAEVGYLALQGGTPLAVPLFPPYVAKLDVAQDNKINLNDYAVLANGWLVEQMWP